MIFMIKWFEINKWEGKSLFFTWILKMISNSILISHRQQWCLFSREDTPKDSSSILLRSMDSKPDVQIAFQCLIINNNIFPEELSNKQFLINFVKLPNSIYQSKRWLLNPIQKSVSYFSGFRSVLNFLLKIS